MTRPNVSPLVSHLSRICAVHADRVAIRGPDGALTYGELWQRGLGAAHHLIHRGRGGQRVGLLVAPGPDWIVCLLGVLLSGGTAIALSSLYPPTELEDLLEASECDALLACPQEMQLATRAAGWRAVWGTGELDEGTDAERAAPASRDDRSVALIVFTSGTTGRPKGALLTDSNVHALAMALSVAWRFCENDVLVHTLPLHHVHGISVALFVALVSGAETRFVVPFDPARVWEEVGRATVLMGVPTQHKKLFDAFDAADAATRRRWREAARSLRLVTSGSAALPRGVGERWRTISGEYPVERYGMTEIGIVLTNPLEGERRPGTVGRPLPGAEVRVVLPDGTDARPGEAGEIWVRGATVFAGYYQDPVATRAAFTDGWFRTGDTATNSWDGYVQILGRTSVDILKSGGYKLSALEIEDVLREHESVGDVAVVGVSDDTWGDLVVAAVVARDPVPPGSFEDVLRSWAKGRLAPYKVPKRVVVIEALPRNALGKVTKAALVERVRELL